MLALNICKMQRGELFLLAGGPPCQGFSVQRRGADEDPRNQLVFKYAQLVDELYPRYFVMENVPNLLTAEKGYFKKEIEEMFRKLFWRNFLIN